MRIEHYRPQRAREVADLFHDAVHAVDGKVYSNDQKEAWAPTPPDYRAWRDRLELKRPLLALVGDRVAGFIELDSDGHIDCCYTHPDFQRKGIASALYRRTERSALQQGLARLFVEASIVAEPFFAGRGFRRLRQNTVYRNGRCLINYSMEKSLRGGNRDIEREEGQPCWCD